MGYLEERRKFIEAGRPLPEKKKYTIPKISEKRKQKLAAAKDENGDTELVRFFKSAMKRMTGYCTETGLRTETKIYRYAIMSICHILPKRFCKSVATHPCIWIEMIPDKHHEWDNISWEEREKWSNWPVVRDKLVMVYPDLAEDERRHFPQQVLDYMEKNKPF